ncbi:putative sugar kinase [Escherichia coli]|uniref:Putative sugar kinase n=1 Tax=Escherichia coli TaxID=562 RepID=A0A485JAU3_ECOLX|nr:putative sugar kinase [Escherichia coli]
MSKKYIIGIDGGSQSTKVVMYDLEGNVGLPKAKAYCSRCTRQMPIPQNILTTIYGHHYALPVTILMSQFAGNKEDIVGIGLGSIRCCRALLKADGTPAAPLISWQDARVTRPYEHTNPDVGICHLFFRVI